MPWQHLRESISTHLPTINAHVDVAYDIPGAAMSAYSQVKGCLQPIVWTLSA